MRLDPDLLPPSVPAGDRRSWTSGVVFLGSLGVNESLLATLSAGYDAGSSVAMARAVAVLGLFFCVRSLRANDLNAAMLSLWCYGFYGVCMGVVWVNLALSR